MVRHSKVPILLGFMLMSMCIFSQTANAQIPDDQRPPLVTDYATYPGTPQAFLTPGCDFSGVLNPTFGARLVATGGAQEFGPVPDLADLPALGQGDLVRMAWTDVAPECIGSAVSFVVKVALGPSFDPNVDQLTGPNGGYSVEFLVAGPGEITFPMPDLARFGLGCDYQLDAIVGIPLQDVGPSGSFFSHDLRVQQGKATADTRTTVISAKNGTYLSCVVPPSTTIPTTTVPPTTIPPTSVPNTVPSTHASGTTAPPATYTNVTSPPATIVIVPKTPIAQTGFPFLIVIVGGVSLIVIGLIFLSAARRKDHSSQNSQSV